MKTSTLFLTAAVFSLSTLGTAMAADPVVDALDRMSTWSGFSHVNKGEASEVSINTQNVASESGSQPAPMKTAQADTIDSKAKISLPEAD